MITIPLRITLLEPALLGAPGGDPNTNLSLSYIPGSVIRGALIKTYLDSAKVTPKKLPDFFLAGQVRFLHAYPTFVDGSRSLPIPAGLVEDKSIHAEYKNARPIVNRLTSDAPLAPKSLQHSFGQISGENLFTLEENDEIVVHTTRDRALGKAGDQEQGQEGSVFQYRLLSRGSVFLGYILIPDEMADVKDALIDIIIGGPLCLGGSTSAGYGLARLEEIQTTFEREIPGSSGQPIPAGQSFTLILLSDAILHNQGGQSGDDVVDALNRRLGQGSVSLVKGFRNVGWAGGFHHHWGLPLFQDWVVQAGSSYLLLSKRDLEIDELIALENEGLGERRAEGFGRLVINWQIPTSLNHVKGQSAMAQLQVSSSLSPEDQIVANTINERYLRQRLDRAVAAAVSRILQHINNEAAPRTSQLARLRLMCRKAASEGKMTPLIDYLQNAEERKVTREQLQCPQIAGRNLLNWLKMWTGKEPPDIWETFQVKNLSTFTIGNQPGETEWQLNPVLRHEYTLRLLDGVLARLMKERGSEA